MENNSQTYTFQHYRLGSVSITVSAPAVNPQDDSLQQQGIFNDPLGRLYLSQALRDLAVEFAPMASYHSGVVPTRPKHETSPSGRTPVPLISALPVRPPTLNPVSPQYTPAAPQPKLLTSPSQYTALLSPEWTPESSTGRQRRRASLSSRVAPESTTPKKRRYVSEEEYSLEGEDWLDGADSRLVEGLSRDADQPKTPTPSPMTPPRRQPSPYQSRHDVRPPPPPPVRRVPISSLLAPAPTQPDWSGQVVDSIHQGRADALGTLPAWRAPGYHEPLHEGSWLLCQPSAPGEVTAPTGYLTPQAWFR